MLDLNLNKNGLSPIIATVLLILLTVLAVTMLTGFIIPFVKESLSRSTECNNYDTQFTFDETFDYNCKKVSGQQTNITFSVSRGNEEGNKIGGFAIVLYSNGESTVIDIINGKNKTNEINMLDSSLLNLTIPSQGETRSYVFHTANPSYLKAELRTILKSGKTCEKISDKINVGEC